MCQAGARGSLHPSPPSKEVARGFCLLRDSWFSRRRVEDVEKAQVPVSCMLGRKLQDWAGW